MITWPWQWKRLALKAAVDLMQERTYTADLEFQIRKLSRDLDWERRRVASLQEQVRQMSER